MTTVSMHVTKVEAKLNTALGLSASSLKEYSKIANPVLGTPANMKYRKLAPPC